MKLEELCRAAGLECPEDHQQKEITGVVRDTRLCVRGCAFVCINGLSLDSHDLIGEAIQKGAVAVVAEESRALPKLKEGVCILRAPSTRRVLSRMLDAWYGYPSRRLKLIGVTGTNGKTSVTYMLKSILEAAMLPCGIIGTVGCFLGERRLNAAASDPLSNMTTPDPEVLYRVLAEMAEGGAAYVLMEVTSHALALEKVEPLCFEAAIFTNLTPDHLDFHKTMQSYANQKAKLFLQSRLGVFNLDDPYAKQMQAGFFGKSVTCSAKGNGADYRAEDVEISCEKGIEYGLVSQKHRIRLRTASFAEFAVINSLQAAACALELGVPASCVKDALGALRGVKGRMERVSLGPGADFTLLIDYAHTPDALEKLLRSLSEVQKQGGRLLLVFGCGGDRDKSKRAHMGRIASRQADIVLLTSDNSRSEEPADIVADLLSGVSGPARIEVELDRAAAIRKAVMTAERGDVVLLAGKGHEEYEITKEGRKPFFEKKIAREAFEERQKRDLSNETET